MELLLEFAQTIAFPFYWQHIELGGTNHYCRFCEKGIYAIIGAPGSTGCDHYPSCIVLKAQKVLKENEKT